MCLDGRVQLASAIGRLQAVGDQMGLDAITPLQSVNEGPQGGLPPKATTLRFAKVLGR